MGDISKRIMVTGAAGFIGFHACLYLLGEGYSVVGVDDLNDYYDVQLKRDRLAQLEKYESFTFSCCDIADPVSMKNLWVESGGFLKVLHLAAQAGVRYSLKNPYAYVQSNLMGQTVILELCRHQEGFEHLVYASSSSVYGGNEKQPYSVSDRTDNPVSFYAATKKSGELLVESYSHMYGLVATGLRFFTVYGPWGRPDMSPHIFAKAIVEGHKLPVYNKGEMERDFTYIDDVVQGVMGALGRDGSGVDDTNRHRVYNLGNNKKVALLDFIATMEEAVGKKADLDFMPMQTGDVTSTCADIESSQRDFGYDPVTSLPDGIASFVKWYCEYYSS